MVETQPDDDGIRTLTEWFDNESGQRVKRVTTIKRTTKTIAVNKHAAERKQWKPFGLAASGGGSVTKFSPDEILVERKRKHQEKAPIEAKTANMEGVLAKLALRKAGNLPSEKAPIERVGAADAKGKYVPPHLSGKYVPPNLRAGADPSRGSGGFRGDREEGPSLRVSNLSDDTTEGDLEGIFRRFGPLQRIFIAKVGPYPHIRPRRSVVLHSSHANT
jgi:translation initiation factor 3 subunit G